MAPEPEQEGRSDSAVNGDAEPTDEVLVNQVLTAGSEDAFRMLYRRHTPLLHRIVLRMVEREADAEDVLQETWMRAAERLGSFAWRSALGTWLVAIAVNIARDLLDRRGRWVDVELEEQLLSRDVVDPVGMLDLERAIAMLPPGCRAVFILHDIEGFTHEEIAAQLGYTAGASKSQLFRARRALRRLLNGSEEVEERNNAAS
jgi:RNA polymerase sigma-70 factor (ECF subfamily)